MQIYKTIPPSLTKEEVCAIDTELYGLPRHQLHRPNQGHFASMQVCFDGKSVYVTQNETDVPKFMKAISKATHLFHNASFDIRHLRRWCSYPDKKDMFDTLILERILWGGYFDSFGLKDLARRYLDILVSKAEREEFATQETMTPEMLTYAATDALLTWQIFQKQKTFMRPEDLHIWNNLDKPALYAILDFKGMPMDKEKWIKLAQDNKQKAEEIQASLSFNLNSPKQVLEALHKMGIKKIESTEAKTLAQFSQYPLVSNILLYRTLNKRASTYGLDFAERYIEANNKVYSDYDVTMASTGRMSSSDPNSQNLPSEKSYRECFIAESGHEIVVLDYSAQEPRITAYESGDSTLLEALQNKKVDVHTAVTRDIYDDQTIKKSDPRRHFGKAMNLGLTYGLTATGLRRKLYEEDGIEMPYEQAEELVSKYFRKFSKVKYWIDQIRKFGERNGYVQTHSGRRTWLNRYNYHWLNNACNSPIQGGAADVTKLALARFRSDCQKANLEFPVIAVVHDEFVLHVPKELLETYTKIAETAMVEEAEKLYTGVPFEVEIKHGRSWACKVEEEETLTQL